MALSAACAFPTNGLRQADWEDKSMKHDAIFAPITQPFASLSNAATLANVGDMAKL